MNLTVQEKKVLIAVKDRANTPESISQASSLNKDTVLRTIEWLKGKGLINVSEKTNVLYELNSEGQEYAKNGLPERRIMDLVSSGVSNVKDIESKVGKDFRIGLVWLSKLGLGRVESGRIVLTEKGKDALKKKMETEDLLDLLKTGVYASEIPRDKMWILKQRKKIVLEKVEKHVKISLTDKGRELIKAGLEIIEETTNITPEMIRTGSWRKTRFRKFDVSAPVPALYPGKRHLAEVAKDYIRQVWIDMGFKEMNGPLVTTSFWNFDALFVPQDHPARELQDTFYVEPEFGELPDKGLVSRVKKAHETGVDGSTGWGYRWDEKEARRNLLRTHTTVLSAMTISKLKEDDLPAKYFSVGPVFRNEALDWKHLFEFTQSEGIVVSEDVNFKHLLGYLKIFLSKLGFDKVRFRPHYFPYTEMSVEPEVFHPVKKEWVELGGAGIFRPEVVEPLLGKPVPVLAWGLGVERLIVDYYNILDLREIYMNDIDKLRNTKLWWL